MVRRIALSFTTAVLALASAAFADEALEACLLDEMPYWQFEPRGEVYRATRLAPIPAWDRAIPLQTGTAVCGTQIASAQPVRVAKNGIGFDLDQPETWVVSFGAVEPDLKGLVAQLGLQDLAMTEEELRPGAVQIGLTSDLGSKGIEACQAIDFTKIAAMLEAGGAMPGLRVVDYTIDDVTADPVQREGFATLNPPQSPCAVQFVVLTGGP